MAKEYIRDFYNKVLGYTETIGDTTIIKDFYGRKLGSYNSKEGVTRDFYGKVIGRGNMLASLLFKK